MQSGGNKYITFPRGLINKPFSIDKALIFLPISLKYPEFFSTFNSKAEIVPQILIFSTCDNFFILLICSKCLHSNFKYLSGSFSKRSKLALAAAQPKGFAVKL